MVYNHEVAAKTSELLLQINAIELSPQNPFKWASGWLSPIYCDNRRILAYPNIRHFISENFMSIVHEIFRGADVVAGVATAGIPHGVLLADKLNLPFIYVRPAPKKHGLKNLIEGQLMPDQDVVVVEDLLSTGKSCLAAVETIREAGANVLGVLSIFSYGFEEARSNFDAHNCYYYSLTDYDSLLAKAIELGYIKKKDESYLAEWRKDPETWGAKAEKV